MNSRRIALATALAATAMAAPALAQDRDAHFNGPYVSGTFGMGVNTNDAGETVTFDTNQDGKFNDTVTTVGGANVITGFCSGGALGPTQASGCRGDNDDIEWSGRIGYDQRMGNWVVGGLFEVSGRNGADGVTAYGPGGHYTLTRDLDHALSARLRAGYTPGGGILFYATGGGSYAKINHGFNTDNSANTFTEFRDGKRVWGWQVGGGAEAMLTDRIGLGIEYLHSNYKDNKYYVQANAGTAPLSPINGTRMRPSDTSYEFHSLRGTLSFHF